MIYTFWEGQKPAYIELCMATWPFEFVLLDYDNLYKYTDLPVKQIRQYPLQQVADVVRVHVLRDNGGIWLDADTIVLGDLPKETILGYPDTRHNTIGFLQTEPGTEMFKEWAAYQDDVIQRQEVARWSMFGNEFTDSYLVEHPEIAIGEIENAWPEVYMIDELIERMQKYKILYFEESYHLSDFRHTDLLMLHNSWTPKWYKRLEHREVMQHDCTLSNILREVLL